MAATIPGIMATFKDRNERLKWGSQGAERGSFYFFLLLLGRNYFPVS